MFPAVCNTYCIIHCKFQMISLINSQKNLLQWRSKTILSISEISFENTYNVISNHAKIHWNKLTVNLYTFLIQMTRQMIVNINSFDVIKTLDFRGFMRNISIVDIKWNQCLQQVLYNSNKVKMFCNINSQKLITAYVIVQKRWYSMV